jgi:3-hydroxyisobutyrate dehydrogenase
MLAVIDPQTPVTSADPTTTRIGWIGTGVMGTSMVKHLLHGGYQVTLTNRTKAKAVDLLELGATWADSPAEVANQADIIFSMVGYPHDVQEVLLGEQGVLSAAGSGAIVVDMTTSEPALAITVAGAAAEKGVHVLDAPVSGGDIGARNATLSIMIGGPEAVVEAVKPCFALLGTTIVRQGDHGAGQHTKMMNQILVASTMVAMAEGLLYAARAGLNLETVLASVAPGAAGSWSLSNLAPRVLRGDFAPGFYVDHFVKDLGIAIAESERMGLHLAGLENARELYRQLQDQGYGQNGTQSLVIAQAQASDMPWPPPASS